MAVTIQTDLGNLKLELFCEDVPKACENFLALAASRYYNNCIFHRNIKGFMIQTGDPSGTGKGGKSIWGRKFEDEIVPHLKSMMSWFVSMTGQTLVTTKHGGEWSTSIGKLVVKHNTRGIVSMANNGANTNGSQFFITYAKQSHLDMKYTVFGRVIDGFETLDDLEKLPVNEKNYKPLDEIKIKAIEIHANPLAD